ncbi:unnamed protein product [Closterium sp. NIES-64]|nr:unnamed protein product [Closterium sp. NIES-64]
MNVVPLDDPASSDLLTTESNPFDRLPQEILAVILRHVAPSGTSFQHALVCKRWHCAACLAQSSVHVAKSRAISSPRLLLALSRFPRLTHLHIDRDGVDFLDDGFLTILAKGACNGCDNYADEEKETELEEEESHEEGSGAIGAGQRLGLNGTGSTRVSGNGGIVDGTRGGLGGTGDTVGGGDHKPHGIRYSSGIGSSLERMARMTIDGTRAAAQPALASPLPAPHTQPRTSPLRSLFLAEDPRSPPRITAAGLDSLFLHCRLLRSLALHCGRVVTTLPPSLVTLPALTSLDISMPCLGSLLENFGSLTVLRVLRLESPSLSSLPESLGQLKLLEELTLRSLSARNLPDWIGQLSSLTCLNIESCSFRHLPESLGSLRSLTSLRLSSLDFDSLPESIGQLSALKHFRASEEPGPAEQSTGAGVGSVQEPEEFARLDNGIRSVGKSGGARVQETGECAGRDCRDAERARGGL